MPQPSPASHESSHANANPGGNAPPTTVAGKVWPWLTALLLMLVIVPIPPPPMRLDIDVDSSLSAVLNYAHERGLQHGKDVVFTYGPLGFLTFFYFSPHAPGWRLAFDVALGLTVAVGLCQLTWRMKMAWRCLLLWVCAWIGASVWPRTDWVINCGLLSWGLLCFVETGRRLTCAVAMFVVLGTIVALTKASFLVLACAGVLVIAIDLLHRRRQRLALGAVCGFIGGYLLGWLLAGQNLANLPAYLANSLAMIRGYNAALGWDGADIVRDSGWRLAWLLPLVVFTRTLVAFESTDRSRWWRRSWLSLWTGFSTFTIWKHGWVRVDPFHVGMFLGSVAVLALALEVLPTRHKPATLVARGFALLACLFALLSWQSLYVPRFAKSLGAPLQALVEHTRCVLNPGGHFERMRQTVELNQREAQLPELREKAGRASIDVFGQHAGYALFNDMNYQPRPVFQSYAACNASLMRLNEAYYQSSAAPEYVLFQLAGMDGRLPVLEDALVLRHLLINYQPVATEERFLLLKRAMAELPRLTLLREETLKVGERIDLSLFGEADLWLEIDLQPTPLGRLRQFLSRPAVVKLATWRDSTRQWTFRHRAPPAMLAAGFVASPMLLRNDAVVNLFAGTNVVRPVAYSIEIAAEDAKFWQPTALYRISRIEPQPGRSLTAAQAARLNSAATNSAERADANR